MTKPYVSVVIDRSKDQVEKRPVVLGLQNDNFVEIVSGLKEGEIVALQKLHQ